MQQRVQGLSDFREIGIIPRHRSLDVKVTKAHSESEVQVKVTECSNEYK
jgi:hypothetical protein